MSRARLLVALLFLASPLVAQPPTRLVSTLPTCGETFDWAAYWVIDAQDDQDCTIGGASPGTRAFCRCMQNGSWQWVPVLLRGPQGPAGPAGAQGPQGIQGPQGPPGSVDACAAWPVGAIFISASATNPTFSLGCGVWIAEAAGSVLVGIDPLQSEFDAGGETGGSKTHTLTAAEMPAHSHGVTDPGHAHLLQRYPTTSGPNSGFTADTSMNGTPADTTLSTKSAVTGVTVDSTGSGEAFSTLQPYLVVYIFRRTA